MRINIQCGDNTYETIGEEVRFNGYDELFVVHANIKGLSENPAFCVSHYKTGFRVEGGSYIDEAIEKAAEKLASLKPGAFDSAVQRAMQIKEDIKNYSELDT